VLRVFRIGFLVPATLFLLLTAVFAKGSGQYSVVENNNKKGLVNKKGEMLIPAEYDDLGWSVGSAEVVEDVIGYKRDGLWGLLNLKNERIVDPEFTFLTPYGESLILAGRKTSYNQNIYYGLINAKGKVHLAFKYSHLQQHHKRLIATRYENDEYHKGLIDDKAKVYIPLAHTDVQAIAEGFYAVYNDNRKIAVYDENGEALTDFELDSIALLKAPYHMIFKEGKLGLVNVKSGQILPARYKRIKVEEDGTIMTQSFTTWYVLNDRNEVLDTLHYDDITPLQKGVLRVQVGGAEAIINWDEQNLSGFHHIEIHRLQHGMALYRKAEKYGILLEDGQELLPALFDTIIFATDRLLVKETRQGKRGWSLMDFQGKRLTSEVYQRLEPLGRTYFQAKRNQYWGVVSDGGKEVIFCKYDSIIQHVDNRFEVKLLGEDGILDASGEWVVLPQKKEIDIVDSLRYLVRSPYGSTVSYYPGTIDFRAEFFLYAEGDQFVEKTLDGKYGITHDGGKRVIQPIYDHISPLYEDSLYIARQGTAYSFITKNGQLLNAFDPRFEEVLGMQEGFVGVKIDGKWGFVDMNGKLRVANRYDSIGSFHEGLAPIQLLGRWGYIDKREVLRIQPKFDKVYHFENGIGRMVQNSKYGLLNEEGKTVLPAEYDSLYRLGNGAYITIRDHEKGLVSPKGKNLIFPRFKSISDLGNGYVIVHWKDRFGLMSKDGLSPIPLIYEALKYDPYSDTYLAAKSSEWKKVDAASFSKR
jgi:hypothetical protein